jgi:hypothetical protein
LLLLQRGNFFGANSQPGVINRFAAAAAARILGDDASIPANDDSISIRLDLDRRGDERRDGALNVATCRVKPLRGDLTRRLMQPVRDFSITLQGAVHLFRMKCARS